MSKQHHLEVEPEVFAGNGNIGRYVFLPGSIDRAERIASRFEDLVVYKNRRGLNVHTGTIRRDGQRLDVASVPSGMGCPSVDIVVTELITCGARRILRVGTCGALQHGIFNSDLVIATGAVRDEGTSDAYTPREFPAVADPGLVDALCAAAMAQGQADRVHVGIVHSKDSFFGREFGQGPDSINNKAYMDRLGRAGVIASEMEAAHLFVLGAVHDGGPWSVASQRGGAARIRVGAVCAVIGGPETGLLPRDQEQSAEERLIHLAIDGYWIMAQREGALTAA